MAKTQGHLSTHRGKMATADDMEKWETTEGMGIDYECGAGKEYEHEALPIRHIISAVIWGLISIGCWLGIFAVIHKVWTRNLVGKSIPMKSIYQVSLHVQTL